jgi:RNA polymerase-binding transcription factor DksA
MLEREADELDQASLATLEQIEISISGIREKLHGDTSETCVDCGQPIPEERLAAAQRSGIPVQRCIHCAALAERKGSLYRAQED